MNAFMNEDKVKANISYWHMLKGLWPYAKRHPWLLVTTAFSIFVVSASSRLMPAIIGYAIDHGIMVKDKQVVWYSAYAFLFAQILHSLSQFSYFYYFQKLGNRVLFYLREDLIRHVQTLPIDYFNKTPAGRQSLRRPLGSRLLRLPVRP
jgi:ATP-binding cassette subfamily B protein